MANHKYIKREWKNGRWQYVYPATKATTSSAESYTKGVAKAKKQQNKTRKKAVGSAALVVQGTGKVTGGKVRVAKAIDKANKKLPAATAAGGAAYAVNKVKADELKKKAKKKAKKVYKKTKSSATKAYNKGKKYIENRF